MLNDAVALTGDRFQALTIQDFHGTAQVLDQARILQNAGRQADAGTPGAQHLREKVVGEWQELRVEAVLTHKEPARQTLIDSMQPVAGGQLGHLHAMHETEVAQFGAQRRNGWQDVLKNFGSDSYSRSRHLHNGAEDLMLHARGQRHSDHPFLAGDAYFHASPIVAQGDNGGHAVIQEIGEIDFFPGFLENFVLRQIDRLEVGTKQVEFLVRQRQEDQIGDGLARRIGAGTGLQPELLAWPYCSLNDDLSFR